MKWNKYTIETTTAAEDYLSSALMDLGIEGVQIEDNVPLTKEDQAEMFIDFLPELPPDEGISYVSFYLEDNGQDDTELLKQVKTTIEEMRNVVDMGTGKITSDQTEDLDWINNWKKFFSSFYIEDILIKPTWEELKEEDRDKFLIEIDPGVSFGTGKHETTQLCIRQLLKYIRGNETYTPQVKTPKVLDVGCGSGILSIVALKLGASEVVGTDLDPDCMTSTHDNMEVNHLDQKLGTFYVGNLIDDTELQEKAGTEEFDIVVANILADVIIPMAPVIPARLKKGGYFITSGIIDFKENDVKEAIEKAGLEVVEINHQGEHYSKKELGKDMYQFFIEDENAAEDFVTIEGSDVNHIKNVLRMKPGEKIRVCTRNGQNYFCSISDITESFVRADILEKEAESTELPCRIYLFQGLPKNDKAKSKVTRWQAIAESAAKQSKRSLIPEVKMPMSYKEAVAYAKKLDVKLVPYENEHGMAGTKAAMEQIKKGESIAVFIGPEGGFAPEEIEMVRDEMQLISLGRRILRTETAGIAALAILGYQLESQTDGRDE